jgi:5-methylcytosine-specific restriction endonuclease McrA
VAEVSNPVISGALEKKIYNLLFYNDWGIAGKAHKETRQKMHLAKTVAACVNCGSTENLTQDHVIPRSKGGPNGLANKQLLCQPCNVTKGARLPLEA